MHSDMIIYYSNSLNRTDIRKPPWITSTKLINYSRIMDLDQSFKDLI